MYKSTFSILCVCLLSLSVFSQSISIESILQQVEQNNPELKALSGFTEFKRLELKSTNNLPDPNLDAYYLPFGEQRTADYTEFEISQSFEFPSVYSSRKKLIDHQSHQLEIERSSRRQKILSQARSYCLNLVYLNKRIRIESVRAEQAREVFKQVQELYENEEIGILELNKASISWMQEQLAVDQIKSDKKNIQLQLTYLNGGKQIVFDQDEYTSSLKIENRDSIWSDKLTTDPQLLQFKHQEIVAKQALKLTKHKSLPNLAAGLNSQGISGEHNFGFYAGMTVPLWSNHNKVKAARSLVDFQEILTDSKVKEAYASFEMQLNGYQIMLSKYKEYKSTFSGLNSEQLLLEAYNLGELSFLEYYMELQFYRDAYDAMVAMQYQLHLAHNQLLKHQL